MSTEYRMETPAAGYERHVGVPTTSSGIAHTAPATGGEHKVGVPPTGPGKVQEATGDECQIGIPTPSSGTAQEAPALGEERQASIPTTSSGTEQETSDIGDEGQASIPTTSPGTEQEASATGDESQTSIPTIGTAQKTPAVGDGSQASVPTPGSGTGQETPAIGDESQATVPSPGIVRETPGIGHEHQASVPITSSGTARETSAIGGESRVSVPTTNSGTLQEILATGDECQADIPTTNSGTLKKTSATADECQVSVPTTSPGTVQNTLGKRQAPSEVSDVPTKQRRQEHSLREKDDLEELMKELRQKAEEKGYDWIRDRCQLNKKESHPSSKTESVAGCSDMKSQSEAASVEEVSSVISAVDSGATGAPKTVWICGDSIVFWASRRARASPLGKHLGLAKDGIELQWLGSRKMMWDELVLSLLHRWKFAPPIALVIHLGGNDLVSTRRVTLMEKVEMDLDQIAEVFPSARIGWSNIIPRLVWDGSDNRRSTEKARKRLNRRISKFVLDSGGFIVSHEMISVECSGLYGSNGVDLSNVGLDIFNANMHDALERALRESGHITREGESLANANVSSEPLANANVSSEPLANANVSSEPLANVSSEPLANANVSSEPLANAEEKLELVLS
ncbi:mucin-5AC-like [Rhinatrema bivittatum]|uniref:mucin-5AC-like n=1 Tax=Rhinatrema bivittatum TaxID=194408 RepID=UPI00112AA996|nr:mucin-5AC-like [Rhinatrema bivittatum]